MNIIITSDGSKSASKSRYLWIISDKEGTALIEGTNPEFRKIYTMHSHRSEMYEVASALLFLYEYCYYFVMCIKSEVSYYCDNLEDIHKIKEIQKIKCDLINYIAQ